ncbi:MAG: hypothetical protein J2P21_28500 [Chloracidobacterium sp.]|nr:hypothetical protein [Chloracidobacterium sp.]
MSVRYRTIFNSAKDCVFERSFNRRYVFLLAEAAPRVIADTYELEHASQLVEPLLEKGDSEPRRKARFAICCCQ